jgi:hypothetical protein
VLVRNQKGAQIMTEEQCIAQDESRFARDCMQHPNGYPGVLARKPVGSASAPKPLPESPTLYTETVEQDCEECGGSGKDPGILNPWDAEPCPICRGSKKQTVQRNFLGEAFQIVSGESSMIPERRHLKAVVEYCRELTSAAIALPGTEAA